MRNEEMKREQEFFVEKREEVEGLWRKWRDEENKNKKKQLAIVGKMKKQERRSVAKLHVV